MTEEEITIHENTFESIKGHLWRLTRDYAGYKKGSIFMPLDIDYETYHVPFVTFLLNGKKRQLAIFIYDLCERVDGVG